MGRRKSPEVAFREAAELLQFARLSEDQLRELGRIVESRLTPDCSDFDAEDEEAVARLVADGWDRADAVRTVREEKDFDEAIDDLADRGGWDSGRRREGR